MYYKQGSEEGHVLKGQGHSMRRADRLVCVQVCATSSVPAPLPLHDRSRGGAISWGASPNTARPLPPS